MCHDQQQPNVTLIRQRPTEVVSPQNSDLKIRRSRVARRGGGNRAKIFFDLMLSTIVTLKIIIAAPGFVFFGVVGTGIPVTLLVYIFIAVTSRHRVAEDYEDYIKTTLVS
jgi:hypothetical protein